MRARRHELTIVGIGTALFLSLAIVAGVGPTAPDIAIMRGLAQPVQASAGLAGMALWITGLGDPLIRNGVAATVILALFARGHLRRAGFLVMAVAGGWILTSVIKAMIARPRPHLFQQLDIVTNASFPSSHAWNGLVVYLGSAIALAPSLPAAPRKALIILAFCLIFAIGLSRIALGVHWPSDVLAGWIGGGVWLAACARLILADRAAPLFR